MALPSNKSSSPSMITGRTSPNSRNSEIGNPVRRSFSGNPFSKPSIVANPRSFNPVTPANSPSDYPRRNSVSRESLFTSRDNEEKENGKDQSPKPVRVRSPTVEKSTKHFMSPTISAASKIAVSPKKKILSDRNEPVRSSLSFSGMKSSSLNSLNPNPEAETAVESETKSGIAPISNSTIAAPPPKPSKTVRFGGFEVISDSYDNSKSTYRYDTKPEVVTMAVETDTKTEIAPTLHSTLAAPPPKASKTVRFGGFEVISGSHDDSESTYRYDNPEVVTMAVDTDTKPEITPILNSTIAAPPPKASKTVRFGGFEVISGSYEDSESTYRYDNPEVVTMAVDTDTKPEDAPISNYAIAAAPPKASKTERFADFEVISASNYDLETYAKDNFTEELDCVNLDPSFKISPVSSPMVAPLDADPLMPPYDPKTNYLSPRPQFLHYRPNRRIERHLNKEPDGSRLEDFFSSANVSESEFTEETDSEDLQKESDESSSNESQMEEEEGGEEEEEEEKIHVSEQSPIEVKKSSKPQFSRIFKISSLLVVLFIACFSICVVNVHDPNIFERSGLLTMEDSSEIYELAKTNFNVLVGKLEVWHANSISFISDVVFNLGGAPPLIYLNQTEFFYKDANVDGQCLVLSRQTLWKEENNLNVMEAMKEREINFELVEREGQIEEEEEEDELLQEIEATKQRETDIEPVERETQNVEEDEESLQEIAIANDPKDGEENEEASAKSASEESLQEVETSDLEDTLEDFEETSAKLASDSLDAEDDAQEKVTEENCEVSSSADFETLDQIEPESATGETEKEENSDSLQQQSNKEFQYQSQSPPVSPPSPEPQSDVEEENGGNIEVIGAATDHGTTGDFTQNTAVISALLLGISLIIPAGLIYARKSCSKPSMAVEEKQEQQQLPKEKKTNQSPVVEEEEEEEAVDDHDDMAGESCSSEMSNFQYSSMRGGGETEAAKRSNEEAQSHSHGRKMRKNSRRESMASSSLDEYSVSTSPSYGSFTSYERIPIKHGKGEEETITPVRRSSRIRKQYNNS